MEPQNVKKLSDIILALTLALPRARRKQRLKFAIWDKKFDQNERLLKLTTYFSFCLFIFLEG